MPKFKLKIRSVPLRIRSFEIYFMNALLSALIKKRSFRTTKIVISLDETLCGKREQMNHETERFFKENFLSVG